VAVLFRVHPQLGSNFTLLWAALLAFTAALVSMSRLQGK
jgi:hypothetical protein